MFVYRFTGKLYYTNTLCLFILLYQVDNDVVV